MPSIRQRFHLSPCSDFRSHFCKSNNARIKIKVKGENRAPAAPVNLSATVGNGQVTLSWDDPGNDTITKYQYSTNGGTNFTDIAGSTPPVARPTTTSGIPWRWTVILSWLGRLGTTVLALIPARSTYS